MATEQLVFSQGDMGAPFDILLDNDEKASLWIIPNFGPDLYEELTKIPLNEEPEIIVGGKLCHQRRDVGFYSDVSEGYRYSGQVAEAFSFDKAPFLKDLMHLVNATLGTDFNGVLVNKYRNGEKYLSHHSDAKRDLDKNNFMVAGIAYGPGIRKFRIRRKILGKAGPEAIGDRRGSTNPIVLDHYHQPRELLIMDGAFQERYTHEIPVEKTVKKERISVTFRRHLK